MLKTIFFCFALCLLHHSLFGSEWSIREAKQLLGKPATEAKKVVVSKGYKLEEQSSSEQAYSRVIDGTTYNVVLVIKAGKVSHLSTTENVYDYSDLLEQLDGNGFQFRVDKSNKYVQTGWRDYMLDGQLIREPVGTPPSVAMPAMTLRFDAPTIMCFIVTPADPRIAALNRTMVMNYWRQ